MEQSTEYTLTRLTSQYIGMEQLCELVNVLVFSFPTKTHTNSRFNQALCYD